MVKVTKKADKAWVTFTFPSVEDIQSVEIVGEWSEWQNEPMRQKKNGEYSITKVLDIGSRFEFGYRTDGGGWHTDDSLPCVASPFGSENAVLDL